MLIHDARYDGKEVVLIADDPEFRKLAREFHPGIDVISPRSAHHRVDLVIAYTETLPEYLTYVLKDQHSRLIWIYRGVL